MAETQTESKPLNRVTVVPGSPVRYIDFPEGVERSREGSIRTSGTLLLTDDELEWIKTNRKDVFRGLNVLGKETFKEKVEAGVAQVEAAKAQAKADADAAAEAEKPSAKVKSGNAPKV